MLQVGQVKKESDSFFNENMINCNQLSKKLIKTFYLWIKSFHHISFFFLHMAMFVNVYSGVGPSTKTVTNTTIDL